MSEDYTQFSMWDLFRMELQLHNEKIASILLLLEQGESDSELYAQMMRAAHSIKGASRVVDLMRVSELAHAMEDVFRLLQQGIVPDAEQTTFLLQISDYFTSLSLASDEKLVQEIQQPDVRIDAMIERLHAMQEVIPQSEYKPSNPASQPSPSYERQEELMPQQDGIVRVSAERMARVSSLSGEIVVSVEWMNRLTESMQLLKREQFKLFRMIRRLSDGLEQQGLDRYLESLLNDVQAYGQHTLQLTNERISDIDAFGRRVSKLSGDLNRQVMQSRMRPFKEGIMGLPRLVRDLGQSLGKSIRLQIEGEQTAVDRDILQLLESPLNHLIRNACDHGIELPKVRITGGKKEQGTIILRAHHRAGQLSIVVEDDGAGIDTEIIRQKIVDKELLDKEAAAKLSDAAVRDYLFSPGFSSRDEVSDISGRGVGLDVVRSVIQEVGGIVRIEPGKTTGTRFILQLPLSHSVAHVLLLDIGGYLYAAQIAHIQQVLFCEAVELFHMEGRPHVPVGEEYIPVVAASDLLAGVREIPISGRLPLLVLGGVTGRYAVAIDSFREDTRLVVQPLDERLGKIPGIAAGMVTREGEPVLLLDVNDCVRLARDIVEGQSATSRQKASAPVFDNNKILYVDDSLSMRELVKRQLQSLGFKVDVAVDGHQGYQKMLRKNYALLISDIQMPVMDGFQLISKLRGEKRFQSVPIIILTTLSDEHSREQGKEVGADRFISKGALSMGQLQSAVIEFLGEPQLANQR
ncbi:hybrid sensor histidine kinase/response regulator [Thiolapillus brandeum]|uniref:Chemotaxis protein CheA n=1 Tax=Thiolapillus brandeum TaxID=1076588 RepID=A0A7U6GIS4_9GAMM|nr:response regulator [Thiolapillus brandeum]BAO44396.1 two-component system chemotaxis family sensor histidine kinase and response regulator WspE [Thiolapillus brandeum]